MLEFEQKYNKRREEKNKRIMRIICHKVHTMKNCYKLFSRDKDEGGRQDRRSRSSTNKFQGKKILKALEALINEGFDMSNEDESDTETSNEQETNLALMANYVEDSDVDMKEIIAKNNIIGKLAMERLREVAKARNKKISSSRSSSTSNEVSLKLNTNGCESKCESTSSSSESIDVQTSLQNGYASTLEGVCRNEGVCSTPVVSQMAREDGGCNINTILQLKAFPAH